MSDRPRLTARDMLGPASVALRARPLRAVLSSLGIAIGIASMVAVVGISSSSRAELIATLDRLGTNLLTASPGQSFFGEDSSLPDTAVEMVERIAPVQEVSAVRQVEATVRRNELVSELETNGIAVVAADPDVAATVGGRVSDGRMFDAASESYPVVVLGTVAAQRLGIEGLAGDVRVVIGGTWFTVIGILSDMPLAPELERSALIPTEAAVSYLGAERAVSTLYVRAHPEAMAGVHSVLAATVNPERPEEVDVARPSDALEARAAADATFTSLLLGLGAVALVVSAIGIANVMVISVLERRTEIGLRRALGATRGHIGVQFLAESMLLAALGGGAGAALGAAGTALFAWRRGWPASIELAPIAAAIALALVVGAAAGLYPALRAGRLDPTEALRGA